MTTTERFTTLNWDDVKEGDQLTSVTFPLALRNLIIDAGGTRDLNPIHHDREYAKRNNARDIFVNTMFYEGFFGRVITDWTGPEGFLRRLRFAMKLPNCPGDTMTTRGWVVKKYTNDEGQKLLDVEIHIDNQLGPDTTIANATVELP